MCATLNAVRVDESGIHYIVSIERVTLISYNGQGNDGIDQDSDTQSPNHRRKDETDEYDARAIGESSVKHILYHVGAAKKMKQIAWWYGYRPEANNVEQLHTHRHTSSPDEPDYTDGKHENGQIKANGLYNRTTRLTSHSNVWHSIEVAELRKQGIYTTGQKREKESRTSNCSNCISPRDKRASNRN